MSDTEQRTQQITTLEVAIRHLLRFTSEHGWLFRGQTDARWALRPRAGRAPHFKLPPVAPCRDRPPQDLERFQQWKRLAVGYEAAVPDNEFEALALAQHHGFPTRLLDFTLNPLVARFFACESDSDRDGAVFAYQAGRLNIAEDRADLYAALSRVPYRARPFSRRILVQDSVFLFFPEPHQSLTVAPVTTHGAKHEGAPHTLQEFIIPAGRKVLLQSELRCVGITRRSLFPDLDGLCQDFVQDDLRTEELDRIGLTTQGAPAQPADPAVPVDPPS